MSGLLFQTLPVYGDLASQKAVLATVRTALSNETFLKTFAATLLRTDGARVSRQESFILFLWSSAVLRMLQLPAAAKAALKLLERQVISHGELAGYFCDVPADQTCMSLRMAVLKRLIFTLT